jgi:acetoin utilization protein AcuB
MTTTSPRSTRTAAAGKHAVRRAIRHSMTPMPHSVGSHQKLAVAHRLMREHGLRHLPVLDAGKLVGLVSQRDLYFVETLRDVDADNTEISEAMTQDTYAVGPDAPIDEVAETMATRKYGCAVVVEEGKVVGVFTAIDALHVLAKLVRAQVSR